MAQQAVLQASNLDSWAMASRGCWTALAGEAAQNRGELLIIEGVPWGCFDGVAGAPGPAPAQRQNLATQLGPARLPARPSMCRGQFADCGPRRGARARRTRSGRAHCRRRAQSRRQRAASCACHECDRGGRHPGARRSGRATERWRCPNVISGLVQGRKKARADPRGSARRPLPIWRSAILISRPHRLAMAAPAYGCRAARDGPRIARHPGQRIAVAADPAFHIYVSARARGTGGRAGAEIVAFFPRLPTNLPRTICDACWLPGGYPELHAGRAWQTPHRFPGGAATIWGDPAGWHGELRAATWCSAKGLEDAQGVRHAMVGLLGHATQLRDAQTAIFRLPGGLASPLTAPSGRAGSTIRRARIPLRETDDLVWRRRNVFLTSTDGAGDNCSATRAAGAGHVSGTFFHAIARI